MRPCSSCGRWTAPRAPGVCHTAPRSTGARQLRPHPANDYFGGYRSGISRVPFVPDWRSRQLAALGLIAACRE